MSCYEPNVDDYVIWDRGEYGKDEGWVYFKAPLFEQKKGFAYVARYITIETSVRDKPQSELEPSNGRKSVNPHTKIHTLLLCYEQDWKDLVFVKRRESREIEHYSQYDDRSGIDA